MNHNTHPGHFGDEVLRIGIDDWRHRLDLLGQLVHDASQNRALLADDFRQGTRVDVLDARHTLLLHPVGEGLCLAPVARRVAVLADHQTRGPDLVRLEPSENFA